MTPDSPTMNIVGHRKIFYGLSGVLISASIIVLAVFGLPFGIDFTGGSLIEVEFSGARPDTGELERRITGLNLGAVRFQPAGERGVLIRLRHIDEPTHQEILRRLGGASRAGDLTPDTLHLAPVVERRFDAIGPAIGRELARNSLLAVALAIFFIVSYIAWAFRGVSPGAAPPGTARTMASWKYGLVTVAALAHDVIIPAGFFALAGHFLGVEVDTLFVTAILTILGFSVHDTIVVFDRIRENVKKAAGSYDFPSLVNRSVNETIIRSINTSLTVLVALGAVYLFGGATTKMFSVTLMIGIVVGTYSSIFIASPLLVTWHQWNSKLKIQSSK